MEIQLGFYPQAFVLVFARLFSFFLLVVFVRGSQVPAVFRVSMAVVITFLVLSGLSPAWYDALPQWTHWARAAMDVLNEILIGAAMALFCDLVVTACVMGGSISGFDAGLSMAQSMDPVSGVSNEMLGQMLQTAFILYLFACDLHLAAIRILVAGYEHSAGAFNWLNQGFANTLVDVGTFMFDWGLRLAFPVLCAAMIVNVCLGLVTRMSSGMNIMFLAFPIRLSIGLGTFAIVLKAVVPLLETMSNYMIGVCAGVFSRA